MKIFWMIVVVLAGVALTLAVMPAEEDAPPDVALAPRSAIETANGSTLPAPLEEAVRPGLEVDPEPQAEYEALSDKPASSSSSLEADDLGDPTPTPPSPDQVVEAGEPAESDDDSSAAPKIVEHEVFGQIVASRFETLDDGWLLYDGRFKVRGSGTEADPYEVPWEMLMSASETYQPRRGKKKLPERITMLHERQVRVTGYVAFPIVAAQQNELLAMRNMWDGCCVGLPPTAYDAVEVRLAQAATGDERFTAFGTVEGLFKVDPYVRGNWLLGLFLMEDAELTPAGDMRRDPSQHSGPGAQPGIGPGGLPAGVPEGLPTDLPGGLP